MNLGDKIWDWIEEYVMPWVMIGFGVLLIAGVIAFIVALITWISSDSFSLRKDDWICTASHVEEVTTYVKSGDVQVPITSEYDECDQWSKK